MDSRWQQVRRFCEGLKVLLLAFVVGMAVIHGAIENFRRVDYDATRRTLPLPGHERFRRLRPLVEEDERVLVLATGEQKLQSVSFYSAQLELATTVVIPRGWPLLGADIQDFLEGMPIISDLRSGPLNEQLREGLTKFAEGRKKSLEVIDAPQGVKLYRIGGSG